MAFSLIVVDEMAAVQRTTKRVNYFRWSAIVGRGRIALAAPKMVPSILGTGRFNRYAAPANLTEHL
jgi:hypothetical protein